MPIITVDQPLYSLAKPNQWSWPASHGADQFVVMFGGLHIEVTSLKALGDLLESSGWIGALKQANRATPETADSCQKSSHVIRTRRAHRITACVYFNRRRTPNTAMVCKRRAVRCHRKTGVSRKLKPVLSSYFGALFCSWNWRRWSTWERYETETFCSIYTH